MKWYQDQQEKKNNSYEKGQISLLNKHLQRIFYQVADQIDKSKYQLQENHINRKLSHCHVWNIKYLNNEESKEIAVEQAVFLTLILHLETSILNRRHLQEEVDRYMRQLGNFDWAMYGEYGRRTQIVKRIQDKEKSLKHIY